MKPKTRHLVILGQEVSAKYAASDGYGGKTFDLPSDHKGAMVITHGGFSCAHCEYVNAEKHECNNEYYIKWNGSKKLPDAPLDKICSDWFEPRK